jgi:hypothetical protein
MKYNDAIVNEYGSFIGMIGQPPSQAKPLPTNQDYANGSFNRVFAKKINDDILVEIKLEQSGNINRDLYKVISINWVISGPRENSYSKEVITPGVSDSNMFEINRVLKEYGVDLRKVLPNPLEYWQGH